MNFTTITTTSLHQLNTPAIAVGVFSEGKLSHAADILDRASNGAIAEVLKAEFDAKPKTSLTLRNLPGIITKRVILVGLGKQESYRVTNLADAEATVVKACHHANLEEALSTLASIDCPDTTLSTRIRHFVSASHAANYHYDETLSDASENEAPRLKKLSTWVKRDQSAAAEEGLRQGIALAEGVALCRKLGDLPPNICTPTYLGNTAKDLAKNFPTLKAEVLSHKQIEALGMNSFLSVAAGSLEPPAFIVLHHTPSKAKSDAAPAPIVLGGKGITFDSGGISIKPAKNLDEMKYDMCGAASVLGTMRAVAALDIDSEVIGLSASCENMPGVKANKPGDIVTSLSGQTIEILNTDEEGRLVLCDALTYAERYKPAAVIDIATLTGACVVALGDVNTGLFSTDEALTEQLLQAGKESNDLAWHMPMTDAYQRQLKSRFADIANIGGPSAGAVTAACFLSRFTKAYAWAHLDIAGTAWNSGTNKGATGRPVPLLVNYLLNQA